MGGDFSMSAPWLGWKLQWHAAFLTCVFFSFLEHVFMVGEKNHLFLVSLRDLQEI